MSNQLSPVERNVFSIVPQALELAEKHNAIDINAEKNYAIQQLFKNKTATDTAVNNPVSVQNAILNLSSIGISLNPALKHAYLVPRDGAIHLDVSYMGLMHIAQDAGCIEWGQARIVYANDDYENQGLNKEPLHKYKAFGDRGDKVGVYCTVKLPSGDYLTEEMSVEAVNKVRESSKSKNSQYSPWNTFEEEMWRKSVVKRASKYWPKSGGNRLETAIHTINEHEGLEDYKEVVDKFLSLYEQDATPLTLWGYVNQWDHESEEVQKIYKSFPKGHKVKIAKLLKEGQKMFFDYKSIFEGDDELAIQESREELLDVELKIIDAGIKRLTR